MELKPRSLKGKLLATLDTFNRTSMELKQSPVVSDAISVTFNRTSMELKLSLQIQRGLRLTFNRTSMELKHC